MNGRRAKLLKRRGETIVELREYRQVRECRKMVNLGSPLEPVIVPASHHGTLVTTDLTRIVNKESKRRYKEGRRQA